MDKTQTIFGSLISLWYRLTTIICSIIIVFALLLITSEVVVRYFFSKSIQFVMQFSGYSLFIVTFLSAAWVLRQKSHIAVTFLTDKFSRRAQKIIEVIQKIFSLAFCIFLFCTTTNYIVNNVWATGISTEYPIRFPLVYIIVIMPIGWLFLSVEFLIQFWQSIKTLRKGN